LDTKKSWYLKCSPKDMAEAVVLVGDPARMQMFADHMSAAQIVAQDREFTSMTGEYKGVRVSVVSVGIGAPSVAIVMEELWELGARVVVRAGTALALNVPAGHFILANGAIRHEGVSTTYLPLEYPAVCDPNLLYSFQDTLRNEKASYAIGILATSDGFYTHLFEHTLPGRVPQRRPATLLKGLIQNGVLGADMETSAVYVVGHYLGLKTLSLLITTVDGRTSQMIDPSQRSAKEEQLVHLVLQGIYDYVSRQSEEL
jgi:uridine phosphorylase